MWTLFEHEQFMKAALQEAQKSWKEDEVPVGCVIVQDSRIIGQGYNRREQNSDPTAHAEILAIRQATEFLKNWRLIETTLYVTLEPCLMCAGAIILARIPHLVFGTLDPKGGVCVSLMNAFKLPVNHKVEVISGILANECGSLLTAFFQQKRKK
ncbi:MAG: tRNA adenosine(34) deaminase TadA [Planctomycetota bacterium]